MQKIWKQKKWYHDMHELNEFQMNVTQRYENVTTIRLTLLPTHALVFVFFFSFLFSKVIIIF